MSEKINATSFPAFFLLADGSGYVDDGREIFDDDPNEDPEGMLIIRNVRLLD